MDRTPSHSSKLIACDDSVTFRHDSVLKVLVSELHSFLASPHVPNTSSKWINFVKEGTVPKKTKKITPGILHYASDWILLNDLNKLVVPSFIAVTTLRPDILIFSVSSKTVVLIELTCPCEENMEEWHKTKFHKYEALAEAIRKNGWSVHLFAVEVGARGYCSLTVKSCFLRLGFGCKAINKLIKKLSAEALKTSFEIWLSRDSFDWSIVHPNFEITSSNFVVV